MNRYNIIYYSTNSYGHCLVESKKQKRESIFRREIDNNIVYALFQGRPRRCDTRIPSAATGRWRSISISGWSCHGWFPCLRSAGVQRLLSQTRSKHRPPVIRLAEENKNPPRSTCDNGTYYRTHVSLCVCTNCNAHASAYARTRTLWITRVCSITMAIRFSIYLLLLILIVVVHEENEFRRTGRRARRSGPRDSRTNP